MIRFDWIYQFSVSQYKFIVLDRPDPFIYQVDVLKRVGYTRLSGNGMRYSFYHVVLVKFYCDIIEAVYAYQHFDQHLL